jgi:lysine 2,3-aminomutase
MQKIDPLSKNWLDHIKNAIRTVDDLREWIHVSQEEEEGIHACEGKYTWRIPPYYASLMDTEDQACPIRLQAIPSPRELDICPDASCDPVEDKKNLKTRRVVHKYPDRVVILSTDACPMYCRHCTRKEHTIDVEGTYFGDDTQDWEDDFAYIEKTPAIRDVLLTGGDPLSLSDKKINSILKRLRAIPHVQIIRIGTRFPVVLPQRITPELCRILERHHPVWCMTHFNHPKEITETSAAACDRLLRHGIPVQNQSVLLKGINDDVDIMHALVTGLLEIRVRPYYLYQCDNVVGVSHFTTPLEKGREIIDGLLGHTSGFALPQFLLTTPLGKIPLWEAKLHESEGDYIVKNYASQQMVVSHLLPKG